MEPEISYTEAWTADQIDVAELTLKKAKAFNWLHHQSYIYYSRWGRVTTFVINAFVFLGSSLGIVINFVSIPQETSQIIQAVLYGIFILASVLGIGHTIWHPENKATEHYNFAVRNKELHADLSTDMVELITHEQIHQMLIDTMKMEIHMRDDAPLIPKYIWQKYYRDFGSRAVKMDILVSNEDILVRPTTIRSAHVLTRTSGSAETSDTVIQFSRSVEKKDSEMVLLEDSYPANKLYNLRRAQTREISELNTDREIEKAYEYVDQKSARGHRASSITIHDENKRRGRRQLTPKDEFEISRLNMGGSGE
jgi:hypothetical protein